MTPRFMRSSTSIRCISSPGVNSDRSGPIPSWLCLVYPFGLTRLTLSRIRLGRGICGRYVQSPREHRSCSSEAGSEDRSFRPKTRRTVSMAGMPLGPSNAQGIGRPASSQKRALMGLS